MEHDAYTVQANFTDTGETLPLCVGWLSTLFPVAAPDGLTPALSEDTF